MHFRYVKRSVLSVLVVSSGMFAVPVMAQDSAAAAAAEIRFQQLEREIRRLTGQIEEQNYEIRRLKDELGKATGDIDVRLNDLEGGNVSRPSLAHSASPQPTIPPTQNSDNFSYQPPTQAPVKQVGQSKTLGSYTTSPQTGAVSQSAQGAAAGYDFAYSFIKGRDFARAELEFAKFMSNYPEHALTSNAKYWYGETFYVRGQYDKAARVFAEGYQKSPKSSKAADNLLKLGMSLRGMGKNDDACVAYKQLKTQYADSSVPVLKRTDTEMKKINCQ